MKEIKELRLVEATLKCLDLAEKLVANRYTVEVKKVLARFKKYNYSFFCGNGTAFFCKGDEIIHDEDKLPSDLLRLLRFFEEHDYMAKHLSKIKLSGGKDEPKRKPTSKGSRKNS